MKIVAPLIVLTAMLLGLPLLGAVLAGKPVYLYLEFSPVTRYVQHAEFSWLGFLVLGSLSLLLLVVLALMYPPPPRDGHHFSQGARYRFPWWDWVAVVLLLTSWILAWSRFAWFRPLQPYTFTPLWALLHRGHQCADLQTGGCLHDHPSTPVFVGFISFQRLVLVVFRVPQPVRAELVLRGSRDVHAFGLYGPCHVGFFDRSPSGHQYDGSAEHIRCAEPHTFAQAVGSTARESLRGFCAIARRVRASQGSRSGRTISIPCYGWPPYAFWSRDRYCLARRLSCRSWPRATGIWWAYRRWRRWYVASSGKCGTTTATRSGSTRFLTCSAC